MTTTTTSWRMGGDELDPASGGNLGDLSLLDVLRGLVGFIREAGYLGIAVGFFVTLYKEMLFLGKDVKPVKEENAKLRAEVREANSTIRTLSAIIDRQSMGWERTTRARLLPKEDWQEDDLPTMGPSSHSGRDRRSEDRGRPEGERRRRRGFDAESGIGDGEGGSEESRPA